MVAKVTESKTPPKVYSYIRFSTPIQELGRSEQRQLEAVRKYAAEEAKLPFDDSLCMTDRGLSGFHGEHLKKGALGRFLELVKTGKVIRGSILVVENIDRLGREAILKALKTIIFDLIENGIKIQTLDPFTLFDASTIDDEISELIGEIKRANRESARKSGLICDAREDARKAARETGKILTARCPAWLTVENDKFKVIPEAQKTIKLIFDLKLKGIGKGTIAKRLNAQAAWTPQKGKWRESYIQKILQNRAVIGEYQPFSRTGGSRKPIGEPIANYYPPVVGDDVFYAVQEQFAGNKGKGGRTGKATNLFTHLVKCGYCAGSVVYADKGQPPKGGSYLVCDNGRLGRSCERHSIRYDEVEKIVLENCKGLRPEEVLPDPDEQDKICQSLRHRLNGINGELLDIKERIENYDDQIGRTKDATRRDKYEAQIIALEKQRQDLTSQKDEKEQELRKAESSLQSFTKWQKDLVSLTKALKENVEVRIATRSHLREFVEKIEVFATGHTELYDPNKDSNKPVWRNRKQWQALTKEERQKYRQPQYSDMTDHIRDELEGFEEANPELVRTTLYRNFVKDLIKRRMSKDGRFLRMHFKTGVFVDLVPDGSIASGMKMYSDDTDRKGYKFISPPIDKLWNVYKMKLGNSKSKSDSRGSVKS